MGCYLEFYIFFFFFFFEILEKKSKILGSLLPLIKPNPKIKMELKFIYFHLKIFLLNFFVN
jgi:hypothetical protein